MLFRVPGPCEIWWGGSNLGTTKAGVLIRSVPNWVPIIDDEHGAEPADYIWAGKIISVECIGMHEDSITTGAPFNNVFTNGKLVGEQVGQDSTHYELEIRERGGSNIWKAAHTEPLPPELLLAATQELGIPLAFMILLDSNGLLFYSIPSYIIGA